MIARSRIMACQQEGERLRRWEVKGQVPLKVQLAALVVGPQAARVLSMELTGHPCSGRGPALSGLWTLDRHLHSDIPTPSTDNKG